MSAIPESTFKVPVNKPKNKVWLISQSESLLSKLTNFETLKCDFGAFLDESPKVIIFDPDHHAVKFCVDQISHYRSECRDAPILIYSCWCDAESVFPLLKAGASGYLLKNARNLDIETAISDVISGGNPLSSEISALLLDATRRFLPTEVDNFDLKTREIEMLQMMSEGFTKKEISEKFNRSIHTIDNHVRKIYLKMGVNNLGEAVGNAFRAGLIS